MKLLTEYALKFVGCPYLYGSNSAIMGLDCSGFVLELLRSVGLWNNSDATAQDIYNKFDKIGAHTSTIQAGHLLFFGKSYKEISHVAMALDPYRMIEAGGGDSSTKTVSEAAKRNAMVRIRLIKQRSDLVSVIKPSYAQIGLF